MQQPLKVLITDDDKDDSDLLIDCLMNQLPGMKPTRAKDGEECLRFLDNNTPDIIFLDINMPLLDGIECLRLIREREAFRHTPIIMHSTSYLAQQINQCRQAGATHYMVKPWELNSMAKLIDILLPLLTICGSATCDKPFILSEDLFLKTNATRYL